MSPRTLPRRRTNLRVIIYVRVSSYAGPSKNDDRQAATASPEIQEQRCRSLAEAKGWTVVGVVPDLDVSGSRKGDRLNRPGLVECRAAVREGRADVILALRLDRLARNARDLLTLAEEMEDNGGALTVVDGGVDMTDAGYGKLILTILAAVAELEAYSITSRTMAGKQAAWEAGRWIGTRRPPFGYAKIAHPEFRDGWTLVLDPERAEIVREMAALIIGGATPYRVASTLNSRGVPTQSGTGKWAVSTIKHMLTHPSMVGRFPWQGDVLRDEAGMPVTSFPPLLDIDTWHNVSTKLGGVRREGDPERRTAVVALLSGGVARCATCGGPLSQGPASTGERRYRCSRKSKGACAHGVSVPVESLDSLVTRRFLDDYGPIPLTRMVTLEVEDVSRAEISSAISAIDRTIAGLDPRDTAYASTMTTAAQRKGELLDRLDALPVGRQTVTRTEDTGETMADAWEAADTNGRRALLLANLRVVVALAARVPGSGHFDPDLSHRVDVLSAEVYALMMGDPSKVAAAELLDS